MTQAKPRVLVLDDEPDLRTLYELALIAQGYEVDLAADVNEARKLLRHEQFDVFLTDMRLPDGLGLTLVQELGQLKRPERCVVITAHGSAENAVAALKAGAFDYLTKPIDIARLRQVVREALEVRRDEPSRSAPAATSTQPAVSNPASQLDVAVQAMDEMSVYALSQIVGESERIASLKRKVLKVARSMAPVLVTGESGTGKELVARALHACSHRAKGPFVPVNCAAIPDNLLEAEFFGALKGSYTGAVADRTGFFQQASGGALFLDEIGELPLAMQSKLLRAIQERQVRPIGGAGDLAVDVRIVSATHRDLAQAVSQGLFRQDLYYRVNVIEMALPALRERKSDLPALSLALLARVVGRPVGEICVSDRSLKLLAEQNLPGNVRELENLLHRAWAMAEPNARVLELFADDDHDGEDLVGEPPNDAIGLVRGDALPSDLTAFLDAQERAILLHALQQHQFNRTAAAQQLGISLRQIRYRIARLRIELPADAGVED